MNATFGRLENEILELKGGLNILCAPNESGKSTWCAFLANMLYGLPTKERGPLADKNRFAPWSGSAMGGRLELEFDGHEITLTRDTQRANAPMGRFSAVYAGTSEPVPFLTAQNCGETLTGVPREVFERSAFIRQSGMAVEQTSELERRIVSLITTGEEDTSFSETYDRLKKQLNRRQYNKTGLIPQLTHQLEDLESALEELRQLSGQLADQRRAAAELEDREVRLKEELTRLDCWEAAEKRQALKCVQQAADEAEHRALLLRSRLEEDRIPENETIGRLRGAIVNLETTRRAVEKARAERDDAAKSLLRMESAALKSPFSGQTGEQAKKEAQPDPVTRVPGSIALRELSLFFLFLAAALGVFFFLYPRMSSLSLPLAHAVPWLLPGAAAAAVTAAGSYVSRLYRRQALETLRRASLQKRFGTTDQASIAALAEEYIQLLEQRDAAQGELNAKTSTAEALAASLTTNEQAILLEVRRFAPAAFQIPAADEALRACAVRRRELTEAEAAAREARLRYEYQRQQAPASECQTEPSAPPRRSRPEAEAELEDTRSQLQSARSSADTLRGRIASLGDPGQMEARAENLRNQLEQLRAEYDAISLAMEALHEANGELQGRFSPALGKKAAELFTRLTDGRYHRVMLDRQLSAAVETADDPIQRDARLLSQGAFDQLYLAVRLAICQMVLPEEKSVPLILDDALTSFDDHRMAAALEYLKELARQRQILLFSCQEREARYLAGDDSVSVLHL